MDRSSWSIYHRVCTDYIPTNIFGIFSVLLLHFSSCVSIMRNGEIWH